PSVVKATGVFGSTPDASFTTGTSTWEVHCFGSVFLFVAHCPKCSVFVSSLSTRTVLSGTEQLARPSRFASSTVNVQPTAELTAVMRSPICESNTAVKALFPTSGSTANCVAAATRLTATSGANRTSPAFGCQAISVPPDLDADSFGSGPGYRGAAIVSDSPALSPMKRAGPPMRQAAAHGVTGSIERRREDDAAIANVTCLARPASVRGGVPRLGCGDRAANRSQWRLVVEA